MDTVYAYGSDPEATRLVDWPRHERRADAEAFCAEARRLRPDMTFGADLIAGFPTETEAHFGNLLGLVEACDLTWLHVFPYSARAGTPAARMPQVPGQVIKARAAKLREVGRVAVRRHLAAQVAKRHSVLMESPRIGRTEQFTEVRFDTDQPEGDLIDATISGHTGTYLTV